MLGIVSSFATVNYPKNKEDDAANTTSNTEVFDI
jgi:hypothetical protein